jgi:hypothetical protein
MPTTSTIETLCPLSTSEQRDIVGGASNPPPTFAQVESMFTFDSTTQNTDVANMFEMMLSAMYDTPFGIQYLTNLYYMGGYFQPGAKPITIHDMTQDPATGSNAVFSTFDFFDDTRFQIDIGIKNATPAEQLYYITKVIYNADQYIGQNWSASNQYGFGGYYGYGGTPTIYVPGTNTLDSSLSNYHTSAPFEIDSDYVAAEVVLEESIVTGQNWYGAIASILPNAHQSWQTTPAEQAAQAAFDNAWNTMITGEDFYTDVVGGQAGTYNTAIANFALGSNFFSSDPTLSSASQALKTEYESFQIVDTPWSNTLFEYGGLTTNSKYEAGMNNTQLNAFIGTDFMESGNLYGTTPIRSVYGSGSTIAGAAAGYEFPSVDDQYTQLYAQTLAIPSGATGQSDKSSTDSEYDASLNPYGYLPALKASNDPNFTAIPLFVNMNQEFQAGLQKLQQAEQQYQSILQEIQELMDMGLDPSAVASSGSDSSDDSSDGGDDGGGGGGGGSSDVS